MDNEFDTFVAGVELGGLRNSTQIRILITYLAGTAEKPLSISLLTEAMQLHGLANYFEITDSIQEMTENGILNDENGILSLTDKGKISFRELSNELPFSVKETALADIKKLQLLEKNEKENCVDIIKIENGYNVVFRIVHDKITLMELSLYTADIEQAQDMKHKLLKNPSKVYSAIVSSLYI